MSLNAARLGNAIGNAFVAAGGDPTKSAAIGLAIATAIVTEITGNAVVLPTPIGLIAPAGGGPVTGTGSVQ
jgi:hypothetical protein